MKREQPFSIIDEKIIEGQSILLVDDVYTTVVHCTTLPIYY